LLPNYLGGKKSKQGTWCKVFACVWWGHQTRVKFYFVFDFKSLFFVAKKALKC
jgi:hypothetical protein